MNEDKLREALMIERAKRDKAYDLARQIIRIYEENKTDKRKVHCSRKRGSDGRL
jgi:hypothetical protein